MKRTLSRNPCDQCHRRKVRCDHKNPCGKCRDANLTCTHLLVRKKRGPKTGKGAIIERLRNATTTHMEGASAEPCHRNELNSCSGDAILTQGTDLEQRARENRDYSPLSVNPQSQNPGDTTTTIACTNALGLSGIDGGIESMTHDEVGPVHKPNTPDMQYYPRQWEPFDLDDNNIFLTFDEFAQNVLADSNFFSYEPGENDQGIFGETPFVPSGTPLGSGIYETPQTAFATTIAVSETTDVFEVTPILERTAELFFIHLYPTYPLIAKNDMLRWLRDPTLPSKPEQTLVWSMCALTLTHVDSWPNLGAEQRAVSARRFIRRCLELRLSWNFVEMATFEDSITSLFIGATFFDLKERRTAWFHVREAITLAIAAGLHDGATYSALSQQDCARRRRAYALLYISERGACMFDSFPVSIIVPPLLPETIIPDEDPKIASGLTALHNLFSLLDVKFVNIWNNMNEAVIGNNGYGDLFSLQIHLRELKIEASRLSDVQRADVLVTQQWLRIVFWQAALKQGFISSTADEPAFTYKYPIDIAMDLCEVVKTLPPFAIQVHGLGIFEKQFEIAYALMDTLALSGTTLPEHHECLRYLLLSLSASPSSRQIYVRTLEKKMDGRQKYRSLAGVELLRDDGGSNSRQNSRKQSTAAGPNQQTANRAIIR